MQKTPTRALVIVLPLLLIGSFQLTGCLRREPSPPPPGGAYRSTSGGAQFDQSVNLVDQSGELIGNIAELSLRNIYRTLQEPATLYLTAGGQGAFVSFDDGVSWRRVEQPLAAVTGIVKLANDVLLLSGSSFDQEGVVVRSLDNGDSWERVLTIPALHRKKRQIFEIIKPPPPPSVFVSSITADPFRAEQVYATTSTGEVIVGEQSGKLWRSLSRVESGQRNPLTNQLIASIRKVIPSAHRDGELLLITTSGKLVRLQDEEAEQLTTPSNLSIFDVRYVQQFPDAIFIGTNRGAYISRDRGASWTELDLPISTAAPVRNLLVRTSPTNPSRMLIAVDSILYRSEDGGQTFNILSLGLPNHIITDITIDPSNAARVLLTTTPAQT